MKKFSITLICLLVCALSFSQSNPFETIGREAPKTLTLSDGKYEEFFPNDNLRQVGSVIVDILNERIVGDAKVETSEGFHPYTNSRFLSVDPLAREYPYYTPYQYAGNTPIQAIDIDGAEPGFIQGNGTWVTQRDGDLQRPIPQQGQEFLQSRQPTEYKEGVLEGFITDIGIDIGTTVADPISKVVYGQDLEGNKVSGTQRVFAGIELIQMAEGAKGGEGGVGGKPNTSPKMEKVHGNSVKSQKPTGNYTNEHASGKTYSGVGDTKRMNKSAERIAKKYNDPVVKQEFTPAATKKDAYLQEHIDIQKNGGAGNTEKNYNKINSPGKKLSEENK